MYLGLQILLFACLLFWTVYIWKLSGLWINVVFWWIISLWSTHAVSTDHVVYCFAHMKTGGNPCRLTSELDSCSHICLLAPRDIKIYQDGYSCHCPPGVQLLYDHRTCNTTGTSWVCWLILGKLSLFTFIISWWRFSLSLCSLLPSLLLSVVGRLLSVVHVCTKWYKKQLFSNVTELLVQLILLINPTTCVTGFSNFQITWPLPFPIPFDSTVQ